MSKKTMYIIKMIDRKYPGPKGHYCTQLKGSYDNFGRWIFFDVNDCFKSKNEAKRHIYKTLHTKEKICRWRPDVNYSYFEIVPVRQCKIFKNHYEMDGVFV